MSGKDGTVAPGGRLLGPLGSQPAPGQEALGTDDLEVPGSTARGETVMGGGGVGSKTHQGKPPPSAPLRDGGRGGKSDR